MNDYSIESRMIKYTIEKNEREKYCVIEDGSDLAIKCYSTYKEAKKLRDHLIWGGGFAGHTPPFFLTKYKINNTPED